jgi:hypothetical protein
MDELFKRIDDLKDEAKVEYKKGLYDEAIKVYEKAV